MTTFFMLPLSIRDWLAKPTVSILAVVVGCVTLVAYAATLAPGLQGGDAGELASAAANFAVAHPPGYPLYVALGKLSTLVPLGTVAQRLNALSALCMAGTAALLTAAAGRSTRHPWAGAFAGCMLAFSPLAWTWATQAEVFALNALCAAALLWCAVIYEHEPRALRWGALVLGIGLGNHHTLILLGAPLLIAVRPPVREVLRALAFFALGTCVYVVLPLAQGMTPDSGWGDVSSFYGFVRHLFRVEYGTFSLAANPSASGWAGLGAFLLDHTIQLMGMGVALALLGGIQRLRLVAALAVAWLLATAAFHLLARFPIDTPLLQSVLARFWLLPLLIACFLAALGLVRLSLRLQLPLGTALVVAQLVHGALGRERSATPLVEHYAQAILDELPQGAVLLTRGDLAHNALLYATSVEHRRDDVTLLDQELMTYAWYVAKQRGLRFPAARYFPGDGFSLAELLDANPTRQFFVVGGRKPGDVSLKGRFVEVPFGLTTRLVPPDEEPSGLRAARSTQLRDSALGKNIGSPSTSPWSKAVVDEYWDARRRRPLALLTWANTHGDHIEVVRECVKDYRALIAEHPNPSYSHFKNLGIAFGMLGDTDGQKGAFRAYLARAPHDEVDRAGIATFVSK